MEWNFIKNEFKNNSISFFVYIMDHLFWWLPSDVYRGKLLLAMHFLSFIAVWAVFFLVKYPYNIISPAILSIVLIQFFIFNYCVVTKAEIKFHKLDFTIIDPLLYILGVPVTNKTRYDSTILILLASLGIMGYKIYTK